MKPWKIVILCSLCMFVGSMYQGCTLDKADAKAASSGIVLEVWYPHTYDKTIVNDSNGQTVFWIENGGDRVSCAMRYWEMLDESDSGETNSFSSIGNVNNRVQEAQAWLEERCCPDGYAFKGVGTAILCVSE